MNDTNMHTNAVPASMDKISDTGLNDSNNVVPRLSLEYVMDIPGAIDGMLQLDFPNSVRTELAKIEVAMRDFSDFLKTSPIILGDRWECIAQSILAMRHIEDARMRMWKVIQYSWNWISK